MKLDRYAYCFLLAYFFNALAFASTTEIHQHKSREISKDRPIPKIEIIVFRDMMDGVNIHIGVGNYILDAPDLAPKNLNAKDSVLHGHAHLFVNGIKRQRIYGSDVHIPQDWLKKGVNQVAISLNSHQHENWTYQKENIVSSIFLDLSKKELVLHHFSSQPLENETNHH